MLEYVWISELPACKMASTATTNAIFLKVPLQKPTQTRCPSSRKFNFFFPPLGANFGAGRESEKRNFRQRNEFQACGQPFDAEL